MCLTTAMFCGPAPVLSLARSSWKTTSSTQCNRFSICQWARTAAAKLLASSLAEQIVAPPALDLSAVLDPRFNHADHREMGEARLTGVAPVGPEPSDVVADAVAALFEAAMVGIGCLVRRLDQISWRIVEEADDVGMGRRAVALEGQQVVAAPAHDGLGDSAPRSHGVDGDEGAPQFEAFEQERDGGDLVGFDVGGLLAEHEALAGRPGGDEMRRLAALAAGMRAARSLAIDGDDIGRARRATTHSVRQDLKRSASSALMTSSSVSWAGSPRS